VSYLDDGDMPSVTTDNFTYNGAFIDVSFDNAGGNLIDLYIVVEDGVTDYSPAAWWELNADYEAGSSNDTYIIDGVLDAETNDEWGKGYAFSTVTADGVNDQQADITIHARLKDTVTGIWSEKVNVTKTYNFNDFNKTCYYLADNPRVIDGEYANHANYYAQTYHTGTTKYTRPDGVDWADDGRRHAYNPLFKAFTHVPLTGLTTGSYTNDEWDIHQIWNDRTVVDLTVGASRWFSYYQIFAAIFVNYADHNDSSDHCFDNSTPTVLNQAFDSGTSDFVGNPLGDAGDNHYISTTAYEGSDCSLHSSHQTTFFENANGTILGGTGDWNGIFEEHLQSEIFFDNDATPWPGCSSVVYYYLKADQKSGSGGGYAYGELANRKENLIRTNTVTTNW
jgi:hypothetical protein